mgnify:CR=1 FL=1|tara:strand:+ start:394 stop:597 length:204 start_codon:yes stop_codon:yes gene_type:complete
MEDGRTKYKIEIDVENFTKIIFLPCGCIVSASILLEEIWQQTGADLKGEKGAWFCENCSGKYFFYLY